MITATEVPAAEGGTPVRASFLVFGKPLVGAEEIAEVEDTLRSGWLGRGPKTERFERDFAAYIGARHAIALNSGTAGLHLALNALGIGPGDEVLTTPLTFAATANSVTHVGATPIFVDVDRRTGNIDPAALERSITPYSRAIIVVHLYGRACNMRAIHDIASAHKLPVIEDAAHAVEMRYDGLAPGRLGDIAVFSFYVTKNMTTGEGGMLVTDDDEIEEKVRVRSLHGLSRDAWKRYSSDGFKTYETMYPGFKYNMTDIQASLGMHQLRRIEANLTVRDAHWRTYAQAFTGVTALRTPCEDDSSRHARHLFTIELNLERLRISRDGFVDALKAENIGAGVHFTPLHTHAYYREYFAGREWDLPNAEYIGERTVSLPLSAALTKDDVLDVVAAVKKICSYYRR